MSNSIYEQDLRKILSQSQYMRKIVLLFPQCTIYAQDLRKIVLIFAMRKIVPFPNAQDLHKILLIFQCAIYAQDGTYFPMHNICARLYLFLQCAIYAQDLRKMVLIPNAQDLRTISLIFPMRKIVLISLMRNICARFAQDGKVCTISFEQPEASPGKFTVPVQLSVFHYLTAS